MTDRVCLVTGGNRGIGRAIAEGLARRGGRVGIVCRRARGEEAIGALRAATGNERVELFLADLSSREEIRRLAGEVRERLPRLDVLVNNAGVVMGERRLSPDGLEWTFAVNHMSYFLLTHWLLDLLRASSPARVVNVASEAHRRARFHLEDLPAGQNFDGIGAYADSKLANVLFTYSLAERLAGTGVTANCFHPGVIRTGLAGDFIRQMPRPLRWVASRLHPLLGSPRRGAATGVHRAAARDVEGVSGRYFSRLRPVQSSRRSYDRDLGGRLWDLSARLGGA
ncbi:MAG: SDR family oxidoreductase [Acidobacteria bacterium]|nr:SDR family oxidoreductase [Acidobacteriota bacterium]